MVSIEHSAAGHWLRHCEVRLRLDRAIEQPTHIKRQMDDAVRIRAMQLRPQRDLSGNFCVRARNPAMLEHIGRQGGKIRGLHLLARCGLAKIFSERCNFCHGCYFGAVLGKNASAFR